MRSPSTFLLAALCLPHAGAAQETKPDPRVDTRPDGSIALRYGVDEEGQKHGTCEAFAPNGKRTLLATYAHGKRDGAFLEWNDQGCLLRALSFKQDVRNGHCEELYENGRIASSGDYRDGKRCGKWVETDASGERRRTAEYRDGRLHGLLRVELKGKLLTRQVWKDGECLQLDDLVQPFPTPRAQLATELRAILDAKPPPLDPADPLAASRQAALRRLMAYRRLCELPFDLVLVPEWNLRCDAAAEACRRNGALSHTPPRPPAMSDERYHLALEGAGHSNLALGASLEESVDSYMDDSDPTNIDRIGHRRWCLDPVMRKTGFGSDGRYHAMWSMDASGRMQKGLAAVYYPPRGWVPIDMFSAHRAFSIILLRGRVPKQDELKVEIRALDADFLPASEPLALDHCAVTGTGFGGTACLVFRAPAIAVQVGQRYLVDVSTDGGKTQAFRYVLEFCEGTESVK